MSELILSIDQGTSGTKAILFDRAGQPLAKGSVPLASLFPQPGHVEQNPEAIYRNVIDATKDCFAHYGSVPDIAAIGISNQRETFLLWDRNGHPLTNAIVWQCKRSTALCDELAGTELETEIRARTGLIVDPYFSGTKVLWLKQNDPDIARAIGEGRACFGTIDSWLTYRLTGGENHVCDITNASRTLFFNLRTLEWDHALLQMMGLEGLQLPTLVRSACEVGNTNLDGLLQTPAPITGLIGDSHAAAFGEGCHTSGAAKVTMGTGSSILMNTGQEPPSARNGMVSTICWATSDRVDYALEGIIVSCGATIQWLRDQLGLFSDAAETEAMARAVSDNGGVYLIPAFAGLGAPYWKKDAKALIAGLTFGTNRNHIARAALESVIFQIKDVVDAMSEGSGVPLAKINADGGMIKNRLVMQSLADLLGCSVQTTDFEDISALGAAFMAGLGAGIYSDLDALPNRAGLTHLTTPEMDASQLKLAHKAWTDLIRSTNFQAI